MEAARQIAFTGSLGRHFGSGYRGLTYRDPHGLDKCDVGSFSSSCSDDWFFNSADREKRESLAGPELGLGRLSQVGSRSKPKYRAIYAAVAESPDPDPVLAANVTLADKPGVVALVRLELIAQGRNSARYQGVLTFEGQVYVATLKLVRLGPLEFGDFQAVPKAR